MVACAGQGQSACFSDAAGGAGDPLGGVLFVMLSGGQYGTHHHALFSEHVMPGSE